MNFQYFKIKWTWQYKVNINSNNTKYFISSDSEERLQNSHRCYTKTFKHTLSVRNMLFNSKCMYRVVFIFLLFVVICMSKSYCNTRFWSVSVYDQRVIIIIIIITSIFFHISYTVKWNKYSNVSRSNKFFVTPA